MIMINDYDYMFMSLRTPDWRDRRPGIHYKKGAVGGGAADWGGIM